MILILPAYGDVLKVQIRSFQSSPKKCDILLSTLHLGNIQTASVQFSRSVMSNSLRPHELIAARQASLSITNSQSSLRLTSIESAMPSSHLIPCHPFLFLPSISLSIRVFSNESTLHMRWPKYWSFSFIIIPSREHSDSLPGPECCLHLGYQALCFSFHSLCLSHWL